MATFGAVKTAIARRLLDANNTAVTLPEIGEAINEAVNFWKNKRFWFNEGVFPTTLLANTNFVSLPADFLVDLPRNSLVVIDSDFPYQVKKLIPSVFDGVSSLVTTGRPWAYTNRIRTDGNGVLTTYPMSDRDYQANLYYLKDYAAIATDGSADNTTNDFLDDAKGRTLIQNHALANLMGELRQDEEMEKRYTMRRDEEYNNLIARTTRNNRSGTLTVQQ